MATPTRANTMPPKKLQPSKPPLPASGLTGTAVVTLGVIVVGDVTVDVVEFCVVVSGEVELVLVVVEVDVVFWVDVVGGDGSVVIVELGVVALLGSNPLSGGTMVVTSSTTSFSGSSTASLWLPAAVGPASKPSPSPVSRSSVTGSVLGTSATSVSGAAGGGLLGRAKAPPVMRRSARSMEESRAILRF